jgi:hypothetical protein
LFKAEQINGSLHRLIECDLWREVCSWQILLQKSAVPDGCSSVIRLRATGFNPLALTPSTQL